MARVYVYVDGFNLYYGSCQGRPGRRWLDLGALSQKLRPADEIVGIRYFSAWVRSQSKAVHQATYVRALRTVPGLHDYMSYFSKETRWMSLVHPTATEDQAEVWKVQEKGSDVNLATYLVLDGIDGLWDEAVVISNDQDLTLPVRRARERRGPVHVFAPNDKPGTDLSKAATSYQRLFASYVRQCQFPDAMSDAQGTFYKPAGW